MKIKEKKYMSYRILDKIYKVTVISLAFVIFLLGILIRRLESASDVLNDVLTVVLIFSIVFLVIGGIYLIAKKNSKNVNN